MTVPLHYEATGLKAAEVAMRIRDGWGVVVFSDLIESEDPSAWLSSQDQQRYQSFSHARARSAFLTGRRMLYHILSEFLEVPELSVGEHGKPFCPDPEAPAFNVSHAGSQVVGVFHQQGPVGIDIEPMGRKPHHLPLLAARVFTEQEREGLKEGPDAFLELWTRKEAVLKTMGDGFTAGAASVDASATVKHRGWTLSSFQRQDLQCAVCVPDQVQLTMGAFTAL